MGIHKTSNLANLLNFIDSSKIEEAKPIGEVTSCRIDRYDGSAFVVKYNGSAYLLEEHPAKSGESKKVINLTDFEVLIGKLEALSDSEIKQVTFK